MVVTRYERKKQCQSGITQSESVHDESDKQTVVSHLQRVYDSNNIKGQTLFGPRDKASFLF